MLSVAFVGDTTVVGVGVARDVVTLEAEGEGGKGWRVGRRTRRVHWNDVTCVTSRAGSGGSAGSASGSFCVISAGLDGELFVTNREEGFREMFGRSWLEMRGNVVKHEIAVHPGQGYAVGYGSSEGCRPLVLGIGKAGLFLWQLTSSTRVRTLAQFSTKALPGNVRCVALSGDATWGSYATDISLGVIRVYEASASNVSITAPEGFGTSRGISRNVCGITTMGFASVGSQEWVLIVGCADGKVWGVEPSNGEVFAVLTCSQCVSRVVCFENMVAITDRNSCVFVWDAGTRTVVYSAIPGRIRMGDRDSVDCFESSAIVDVVLVPFSEPADPDSNSLKDQEACASKLAGIVTLSRDQQLNFISLCSPSMGQLVYSTRLRQENGKRSAGSGIRAVILSPEVSILKPGKGELFAEVFSRSLPNIFAYGPDGFAKIALGQKYTACVDAHWHGFQTKTDECPSATEDSGDAAAETHFEEAELKIYTIQKARLAFPFTRVSNRIMNGSHEKRNVRGVAILCSTPEEEFTGVTVFNAKRWGT